MTDRVEVRIREEFERYHAAVRADAYRVTAMSVTNDGRTKAFILDKDRKTGVTSGFTPRELMARAGEIARLHARHENLYYTPLSATRHHILVDDLNREKLTRLIADGFRPAAVLESSPGNYQAILSMPKLGHALDRKVANDLTVRLNLEYGDPKLTGAIHPHRIPASSNYKPKHKRSDGTYPEVKLLRAEARDCERSLALTRQIVEEHEAAARRARERAANLPVINPAASGTTVDAYYRHHRDIVSRGSQETVNHSSLDSKIAVRLRATGHPPEAIAAALEYCSPTIRPPEKQDRHVWSDYAQRTVDYAFGPKGDVALERWRAYHDQWRRLETRVDREPSASTPASAEKDRPRTAPLPDGPDI